MADKVPTPSSEDEVYAFFYQHVNGLAQRGEERLKDALSSVAFDEGTSHELLKKQGVGVSDVEQRLRQALVSGDTQPDHSFESHYGIAAHEAMKAQGVGVDQVLRSLYGKHEHRVPRAPEGVTGLTVGLHVEPDD